MKASLSKRSSAYLIDIIIILLVLGLLNLIYSPNISVLNNEMDNITLNYINGEVNFKTYMLETSSIYKQIDIKNIFVNIIDVIIIICYFIILPYLNGGKTIGKNLIGLEVKAKSNQPLSLFNLLIRNLIITGLFYLLIIIIFSLFIPENLYLMFITFIAIIQIGLLLISIIMVLYRKDKKGLHDILARTWVSKSK